MLHREYRHSVKVVHLSTHDVAGGAARAALRIHEGLLDIGVSSSMLVAVRGSSEPSVHAVEVDRGLLPRLRRRALRGRMAAEWKSYEASRPPGLERFSDDRAVLGRDLVRQLPRADLLHLHWVADLVDYNVFFRRLPPDVPIVWTLHDMNPFTGGCHYDGYCGRFVDACGACPQLGSTIENDLSRDIWERKRAAFARLANHRLHVVTPSQWLRGEANRSSLLGRFRSSSIHYGLDTAVFAPSDRAAARARFNLDPVAPIVLFVADSLENRRKGFPELQTALSLLPQGLGVQVVSIGRGGADSSMGERHIHLEHMSDDASLAALYCAADLFVVPSLQENYAQTALEAMACGTPAVGFDVGGVRQVIRNGETGSVVPLGDAAALAEAIRALLENPGGLGPMRRRCREIAEEEHTLRRQAERYRSLYDELLEERGSLAGRTA